jgi:hypothetical protein
MKTFKITNKGSGYVAFNIGGKNVTISPQNTVTVDVQERDEHVIKTLEKSLIIGPNLVIEEIHSTSAKENNQQLHSEVEQQPILTTETTQTVQEEAQKAEIIEETIKVEDNVKVEEVQATTTEVRTNTQKRRGGRPRKINPQGA